MRGRFSGPFLSSVNGHSFLRRLYGDAKGLILILFTLVEDPLVHDLLHDLVFGYLIGLMLTYATICSACSWCSPTLAMYELLFIIYYLLFIIYHLS